MRYFKIIFVLCSLCLLLLTSSSHAGSIAIIVNKENTISEVSYKDLVKIFKQEKQYWKSGEKIYLIIQERGSAEKKIALEKIYNMNDEELKKFWLTKLFRGEISSFPKTLGSSEGVKRFISKAQNAIGFIDASFVDESVKVLRIDGKLPDDNSYILADKVTDEN